MKNSTKWDPKELWDGLKKRFILQNFALKCRVLYKLHAIWHSECKNITKYMSRIKDTFAEIDNLKIIFSEAVVIYALNNLKSHFWPYFAILGHNAQEKEKLPTLSKLTKALEDKQLHLSN